MIRLLLISLSRLIPAGAGKTPTESTRKPPWQAHPRRCGENVYTECLDFTGDGSSPQVRGQQQGDPRRAVCSRLIPAGAGKTIINALLLAGVSAHPRRCGENAPSLDGAVYHVGSSPQVRGKHLLTWSFIPT